MRGYAWAKQILNSEPIYLHRKQEALPHFPAIDCPQEYKEMLCALWGKEMIPGSLGEPIEALGNRSVLQVLKQKDYLALQEYIAECVILDISGPGAL